MPRKPSPESELHEREMRLAALDVAIERGLADAGEGRTNPLATVFDRLEARYRSAVARANKRLE
jgi:antitoxin ParD1/3/4